MVCHEAIANCYGPCLFYFLCLATLVLIILCFSHDLNKSLCWLLHSSAKAKALLGLPPPPSGVLPHPRDPSSLETPVRPRPCRAVPRALSPHTPSRLLLGPLLLHAADGPYLYLYHSTHPGWKSSTHSAYCSCCTVNSVRKKNLILYLLFQQTARFFSVVASVHCSTVSHFLRPQGL